MRRIYVFLLCGLLAMGAAAQSRTYESVAGDPMQARIYTLENGLKVYLSVNKNEPRIQTYIAVRAGGKNDPAETTGLAHYLEHIMFKGTSSFGTQDYAAEKPLLDQIRNLYEVYRTKTDPAERKAIYHEIDSISYKASTFAIANEYDKLMAAIGANGTNAYTSRDVTCYTEDIPSNEMENWAIVQSDRFKDMVIRGFHTELEAVYEEYNRGLTSDMEKMYDKCSALLFPHHPYGKQTVIGTQEHLKNPSIVNIENYFHQYYVPNNVAICMSGDLDFDATMDIIERYFGNWKASAGVPAISFEPESPITSPLEATVTGQQSEMLMLGWRMPGRCDKASDYLTIIEKLLSNGKAGLIDQNLTQKQKVLEAAIFADDNVDYSTLVAIGVPKEGQTLDDVRGLLVGEIAKIARGEFDESLLQAIINNQKLSNMRRLEKNESRASMFVDAFVAQQDWKDVVERIDRLSRIGKQDVVSFAQTWLRDNNYACVYKRQGTDPNQKKIDKPAISPIEMNRDKTSQFVQNLVARRVEPIQPVFVDLQKDLSTLQAGGQTLLYKHNDQNETFSLVYLIERGSKADKFLPSALDVLTYLGTKSKSAETLLADLYRMACNMNFNVSDAHTTITIQGLAENQAEAMQLVEDWMENALADQQVYDNYVQDVLKGREIAKTEEQDCYSRLAQYCMYGPENEYTHIPSADELRQTDPQALVDKLKELKNYQQTFFYYGPSSEKEVAALLKKHHKTAKKPIPAAADNRYQKQPTPANEVYLAPYESKAIRMSMYSNGGDRFDPAQTASVDLFNEYFGGGMNGIVFQELRESRGLAYQAAAFYRQPQYADDTNAFQTFIITQNDKMGDCIDVFHSIIEQMPASATAFPLAKEALLKRLATERIYGARVLDYAIKLHRLGLDQDPRKDTYQRVQGMTLADVVRFSKEQVAGRTYKTFILGDENELDLQKLQSLGTIHRLSLQEIFGY